MNKNKNLTTGIIIVAIILVLTISAALYQQKSSTNLGTDRSSVISENETGSYIDGTYSAEGTYISPGGAEEIDVSLTLEEGIIVDSEVQPKATRDISSDMQEDFAANYKQLVIGKSIDEVNLTKVSGSSLTPNGFNDAVEKIKNQARS